MFSFFKKKQNTPKESLSPFEEMQKNMRREVESLRAELGDDALVGGMQLLDRINILETVKLPFFQGLLELTDEVSGQVIDQYEPLGDFNALEVHGFCACIVATAVSVINLPDDEKPFAMDIYFDLWVDSALRNGKNINGPSLKDRIVRTWGEYRPFIYHAEVEPVQYIIYKPTESAARRLVSNVDRLAGVTRSEVEQQIAATRFKSTISEAVRITDELAFPPH
ncbi:hypothetical protein [Ensifer aridi]|uniref:hypothetical protein n=1 Tax=Ensifer aridi TaxID=1708715 RepID=UPI0003FA1BA3|nr:hypothetical protein [Ensifer aridi]